VPDLLGLVDRNVDLLDERRLVTVADFNQTRR
jgi:hypothetical protein